MSLSHTPGPALAWMLQVECPAPCLVFAAVRGPDRRVLDFRWTFLNPAAEQFVNALSLGPSTSLWTDDRGPIFDFEACVRVVETGESHRSEFRCLREGVTASYQALAVKHADGFSLWLFDVTDTRALECELQTELEAERAARRKAEDALALFDTFGREAPIGWAMLDLELKHVRLNSVFARFEGLELASAAGAPLSPQVSSVLRPLCRFALKAGTAVVQELSADSWLGGVSHGDWQVAAFPVHPPGSGEVRVGIALTDISERKLAERQLGAREEQLRLALEAARMVAWEWRREQRLITWSPHAEAFFGLLPGALEGGAASFLACVHPDDRALVEGAVEKAFGEPGPYCISFRSEWPDGSMHFYEVSGQTFHVDGRADRMLGVVQDCTDRELAARALRDAGERYRLAAWATNDVLYDWDVRSGSIIWTDSSSSVFGFAPGTMGSSLDWWRAQVHPDDLDRVIRGLTRAVASGSSWREEYRFRRADGVYIWLLDRGKVQRDEQGAAKRMIGSMMDVTDRRRAVEHMSKEAEFRERFIGILGHDLRNPLNALLLSAHALRQHSLASPEQAKLVQRIEASAQRMGNMIAEMLDFTRARLASGIPLQMGPVALDEVCRQVIEELSAIHATRRMVFEQEGEARGYWDGERLAQVVSNLVGNALEHSPPDVLVTVRCLDLGEEQLLEVHNGGGVIPGEALPTLFDPFRQARPRDRSRRRAGLGLGLFIVREIVGAHGGHVEVHSSAESGTTFRVHLPREAAPTPHLLPGEKDATSPQLGPPPPA